MADQNPDFDPTISQGVRDLGYNIVDENNNVVGTVEYGSNGIDQSGQTVYQYTNGNGEKYFTSGKELDPFIKAGKDIEAIVNIQAPQFKPNGNRVTISAPAEVLKSPVVAQMKEQIQTFKGQNLEDPEVKRAFDIMNEEIKTSVSDQMIQESFGWKPEEYKDYQYSVQTMKTNNPIKSTNKIKGFDKDGNVVEKTPAEWVDYYQKVYSVDERTEKYLESLQSNNPYARNMYMVMSGGNQKGNYKPVYGYTDQDRINQFFAAAGDEFSKIKEMPQWITTTNEDTRRAETTARGEGLDPKFMRLGIENEEEFNKRKEEIKGKAWSELSDEDKAFLIKVGATIERDFGRELSDKELEKIADKEHRGSKTDTFAWDTNEQEYERTKQEVRRDYESSFLKDATSDDDNQSRDAINAILNHDSSFDKFNTITNDLEEQYKYLDEQQAYRDKLDRNALWASAEQMWGRFGGTIARYAAEELLVRALTGGHVSMGGISSGISRGIMKSLAKRGISPTGPVANSMLRFGLELAGTIPEDIIQTAVDNTLTNNPQDNANIFSPKDIEGNLKVNFVIMAIFNAAKAGINSVKNARMMKNASKKLDLATELNIEGVVADSDDIVRAVKNGGSIDTDGPVVKVLDPISGEKELKNITPEQGRLIQNTLFDVDAEAPLVRRDAGTDADIDNLARKMASVEVDTPDGRVRVLTPDYSFGGLKDALSADIHATPAGIKQWHTRALESVMGSLQNHLDDFHNRFGDVRVSDFDWVWHNSHRGLKPSQIIGTVDPTTGRQVTQNMIDAMQWWSKQPFTQDLRTASRTSLGKSGDFDTLGYLPHTTYNPATQTFEDALSGQLWQKATGQSVLTDTGEYKGFGGDFENRYRTFASNMLWDARHRDVLTAKMMEVAELEGNTVTPEQARKAVDGELKVRNGVDTDVSTESLVKAIESPVDGDEIDWKKIDGIIESQAKKSGLGKSYHDVLGDIYSNANTADVISQRNVFANNFTQLSDFLKGTVISLDGQKASLYDWGGADLVYAYQNATDIVNRFMRGEGNFREMLTDYVVTHSHRPAKYADAVVDKMMAKLGQVQGPLTKEDAIRVIGGSMKGEAWSRIKKWLVNAKYEQFNGTTKNNIDRFLFNHLQEDVVMNNNKLKQLGAKALDTMMGFRYRSLFYGNLKNAILQTTELNRFFYAFKWGDIGSMAKRLASDANFRARVDDYADAVLPRSKRVDAEVYQNYGKVIDTIEVKETETVFNKMKGKTKDAIDTLDNIALYPIETAENFKNHMMLSALVAEADNLGLTGDDALRHIRNRFERVALAQNEMGRIGLANIRLARPFLFLQNFQIRELGMNYYNIKDILTSDVNVPKKVYQAFNYLTKWLGAKMATAMIMSRLGYSANQALGIDPFGLLEENRYLDREEMQGLDYLFNTPIFAGGMTSLIAEAYFMARQAYEESQRETLSDEVDETIENTWGLAAPGAMRSGQYFRDLGSGFLPGNTFFNRFGQMNELMDTGWAVSGTGNMMYTAPTDPFNIVMGYLFGRNATQNAQQYNQTSGDNLWQALGRMNPVRAYNEFDPIDDKNYTDWFKGDGNDLQQFNKGVYYFRAQKDKILNDYESVANSRNVGEDELDEAKNSMNQRLEELFDKVERFVDAYEEKNGTISAAMVRQIMQILNTNRRVITDSSEQDKQRRQEGSREAAIRYSQHGFSPVGTYYRSTDPETEGDIIYQGSPQWRAAKSGYWGVDTEIVSVLKLADAELKKYRDSLKEEINTAYEKEDWDNLEEIQKEYLNKFDQVVSPIVAMYGVGIFKNDNVNEQFKAMLSTGTQSRSGNLIPSEQYKKNKKGQYQSMPYQEVDIGKWAEKHFGSDTYKKPTYNSQSTAQQDLAEVKKLSGENKPGRARAKALQLKARVDAQTRTLPPEDYKWLTEFINK